MTDASAMTASSQAVEREVKGTSRAHCGPGPAGRSSICGMADIGAWPAYVEIGPRRYRERFGLAFEPLSTGLRFQHRPGLTLSQQDNRDECLDTLNQQMLHFDQRFA